MSELRPETRAFIAGAVGDEAGPSAATQARMRAAIAAEIAAGLIGASAAEAAPSGGVATGAGATVVTKLVVTGVIASVMAAGVWTLARSASPAEQTPPSPSPSLIERAPEMEPAAVAEPAAVVEPESTGDTEAGPAAVVERAAVVGSGTAAVSTPRPFTRAPSPATASAAPAHDDYRGLVEAAAQTLAEETELLEDAEARTADARELEQRVIAALQQGEMARARALLTQLEAEHPMPTTDPGRRALIVRVRGADAGP